MGGVVNMKQGIRQSRIGTSPMLGKGAHTCSLINMFSLTSMNLQDMILMEVPLTVLLYTCVCAITRLHQGYNLSLSSFYRNS